TASVWKYASLCSRVTATRSEIGSMVPISLFACMMLTSVVSGQRVPQGVRIHEPVAVDRQPGYLEAIALEGLDGTEHGIVFDGRGDQMPATVRISVGNASQGKVVTLGAAGGKDHVPCLDAVESRDLVAGLVDRLPGALAETIDAGGIAELLGQVRHHGLENLGVERRGGRMVQVHHRHHSMVSRGRGWLSETPQLAGRLPRRTAAGEFLHGAAEGLHVLMDVEHYVASDVPVARRLRQTVRVLGF